MEAVVKYMSTKHKTKMLKHTTARLTANQFILKKKISTRVTASQNKSKTQIKKKKHESVRKNNKLQKLTHMERAKISDLLVAKIVKHR